MIKSLNEGFDKLLNETSCKESDTRRFDRRDELGDDVAKYQRWVDYDMKRFGRISKRTTDTLHKAGLDVVKDQYGDYEVISKSPITEGKRYGQKNFYFETSDGTYSFYCSTEDTRYGFRHLCDVFKLGEHVGEAVARYYNRTWESYQYQSVLLKAVDSIVGISDEARGQLIDKIDETDDDVREEKCDEEINKKGEKDIISWWEDVDKWNSENGSPYDIGIDPSDIEGMHIAMWDMLLELKDKSEDLYKRGRKIYNRYAVFSKLSESEDNGDIPDDEYYAELEAHIKRIPSYKDDDLKAEYKEFKDSTHEDDKRVEDALFAEMKKRGFVEGLKEGKTLNEGTSNFWSMYELPLLIFDDYESVDDTIYDEATEELREKGIDPDDDDEVLLELVEKKWDEIDYCTLTEEEQENLRDDIKEFNRRMRYDYDDITEDLVEIKPGYYQAAQLYCNDRGLDNDVIEELKKFFDEMKKKYYLTELSVSWRASNGETGYNIVK